MKEYGAKRSHIFLLSAEDREKNRELDPNIAEKQHELEQSTRMYPLVPCYKLLGDGCSNQSNGRKHDEVGKMH